MATETIELYQEPCDCGSRVTHNNGGNYHEVINVRTYTSERGPVAWCVILETTTTRESFPREELDSLLLLEHGFVLARRDRLEDDELDNEADRFRRGEAKIIAQS